MMKEYGDEPFIRFVREKQVMGRNWDIRKGSVWPDGEEMLFAEREVIKKRLWLWMPDSFSKLSEELALVKYPDQNCPDLIYTDPTTTVIVSFTKMQMEAGRETEACDSMERQIRDAYGEESVQGPEIVYAGEMEIPCLISVTPALDAAVYNRMFFFSLEHNVYLGVCNCLEQSDWKELFAQMVASIRAASQ